METSWVKNEQTGRAIFDFIASGEDQITLQEGDEVQIYEQIKGWYKGKSLTSNAVGIFPSNHIQLDNELKLNRLEAFFYSDPLVKELTEVLVEWSALLRTLAKERKRLEFVALKFRIAALLELRDALLKPDTKPEEKASIRQRVLRKIEGGKIIMRLDLFPTLPDGTRALIENCGAITLLRLYQTLENKYVKRPSLSKRDSESSGIGGMSPLKRSFLKERRSSSSNFPTLQRRSTLLGGLRAKSPSPGKSPKLGKKGSFNANDVPVLSLEKTDDRHMLLTVKSISTQAGEELEAHFSIYSHERKVFLTEDFIIALAATGIPFSENANQMGTLFKNLDYKDFNSDLYLCCKLIRRGKLLPQAKDSKQKSFQLFRRPYGFSVVQLNTEFWKSRDPSEQTLSFFYASDNTFANTPELIISKASSLQSIKGATVNVVMKAIAADNVHKTYPVCETNRLSFPDVISPKDARNDLYITLVSGEQFSQETVEVSVEARLENGELVQDCFSYGTGERPVTEWKSIVLYHEKSPVWNDTFKLTLAPELVHRVHLYFNIRHCAATEAKDKGTLSFAFLKISNADGTVIADNVHSLPCYKPAAKPADSSTFYLTDTALTPRKGEFLSVKTKLCSTVITQNASVLKLLKWKENREGAFEVIKRFEFLDQLEMTKFIYSLLDALFNLLTNSDTKQSSLAFNALIHMICILIDDKTFNYLTFLEEYAVKEFNNTEVHKYLLECLTMNLEVSDIAANAAKLRSSIKALPIVFKLIIQSALRFKDKESPVSFQKELCANIQKCLNSLNKLMQQKLPATLNLHSFALKGFASLPRDLREFFSTQEVSDIICKFVDSIPIDSDDSLLVLDRLKLIDALLQDNISRSEGMLSLIPKIYEYLTTSFGRGSAENMICISILGSITDSIQREQNGWNTGDLIPFIFKILPTDSQSKSSFLLDNKLLAVTTFLSVLGLLSENDYTQHLQAMSSKEQRLFIMKTLSHFKEFMSEHLYPEHWIELHIFLSSTILHTLQSLLPHMLQLKHSKRVSSTKNIWEMFFDTSLKFLSARVLNLEACSWAAKKSILNRRGDMRLQILMLIHQAWKSFKNKHQLGYFPQLVKPIMQLMLIRNWEIKKAAMDFYVDMMRIAFADPAESSTFSEKTTKSLQSFAAAGVLDQEFEKFFTKSLESSINDDSALRIIGQKFLQEMHNQTVLLYELVRIPPGVQDDDRVAAMVNLMDHLKNTTREEESYAEYVHQLVHLQLSSKHYVEAGLVVLKHAELLDWTDKIVESFQIKNISFPQQTEKERKEYLYKMAIEYFDRAKCWEKSIELVKELQSVYEEEADYKSLAKLVREEAQLMKNILETERVPPTYYRVGLYGGGFPSNIRGKEFVYRRPDGERLGDFVALLQEQYPNSQMLKSTEKPNQEIMEGSGRHLLIATVIPTCEEEASGKERKEIHNLPSRMKKYVINNDVNMFLYSKPFRKNKEKTDNEFEDLWIANKYFITQEPLPTVKRRSEIIKHYEIVLSPIENANNSIKTKNRELEEIISSYEADPSQNINPFSMALNGVIDAAVNGGVAKYHEVFFSAEYAAANPDKTGIVAELKEALNYQIKLLTRGLELHSKLCGEEMRGMQEKLETFFTKMKAELSQSGRHKKVVQSPIKSSSASFNLKGEDKDKWKKLLGM